MFSFTRFTLARQFMLMSFIILVAGMTIIGLLVSRQIESKVMNQTAAVTALYVDSFISPHLQRLSNENSIDPDSLMELDKLLIDTPLGQHIVSYKIWSSDGQIIYSPNTNLIGRIFSIEEDLERALSGDISTHISALDKPEHEYESPLWDELIETYAPVRADGSGEIIAVSEFYQLPDSLKSDIRAATIQSWLVIVVATLLLYILLTGLVRQASNTILNQRNELQENVIQLREFLSQNKQLHNRVLLAANRTTALNEQFLRRVSSDLHDGPIQDQAIALLRIEALEDELNRCLNNLPKEHAAMENLRVIQRAIESSMKDIRAITAGLRLPDFEHLEPAGVAARAVRDYTRKTAQHVTLDVHHAPVSASVPVKITLYRVIQEALSNAFRHAGETDQSVKVWAENRRLTVEVLDSGAGFDPQTVQEDLHIGLVGMRERVELLEGDFNVDSTPGHGTRVKAMIPMDSTESTDMETSYV